MVYFTLKSKTSTKLVNSIAKSPSGPNIRLLEVNRRISKEATAFFYHYNIFTMRK